MKLGMITGYSGRKLNIPLDAIKHADHYQHADQYRHADHYQHAIEHADADCYSHAGSDS